MSVSPDITMSEGRTPTLPAARGHHSARRPHDKSDPIWEILGKPPDALSMKSPAFMIASSSASAHNAAELTGPSDTNASRIRLVSRTTPLPQTGRNCLPARRASTGAAIETIPKIV